MDLAEPQRSSSEEPEEPSRFGLASGETARLWEMALDSSSDPGRNVTETFFCCIVCYGVVKKPRLCPKCSHFACLDCLRRWYSTSAPPQAGHIPLENTLCPYCRTRQDLDEYIKCPWVEELVGQLQKDGGPSLDKNLSDQCCVHQEQKTVYCDSCQNCICATCALFSGDHAQHKFSPIDEIYNSRKTSIRVEMEKLLVRLRTLEGKRKILDRGAKRVRATRDEYVRDSMHLIEMSRTDLAKQMTEKLTELQGDRGLVVFELEVVQQTVKNMQEMLSKAPKSGLIMKTAEILADAKEVVERDIPAVQHMRQVQYNSMILPPFKGGTFVLHNFDQLPEASDPVYSDIIFSGGLKWRLKVYPNYRPINMSEQVVWLSVFLELHDGPPGTHFHEYRIELIHQGKDHTGNNLESDPEKNICKEFTSKFEVGECWGSNRFYQRNNLAQDGFVGVDGSVMLKYAVRSQNYARAYEYAEWYIEKLQASYNELKDFVDQELITDDQVERPQTTAGDSPGYWTRLAMNRKERASLAQSDTVGAGSFFSTGEDQIHESWLQALSSTKPAEESAASAVLGESRSLKDGSRSPSPKTESIPPTSSLIRSSKQTLLVNPFSQLAETSARQQRSPKPSSTRKESGQSEDLHVEETAGDRRDSFSGSEYEEVQEDDEVKSAPVDTETCLTQ